LINYARKFGATVTDEDFQRVLLKWPQNRRAMLEWWQHSTDPLAKLPFIRDLLQSAEIVDDATLIDVAPALVVARLPRNAKTLSLVFEICAGLSSVVLRQSLDIEQVWHGVRPDEVN
jgi:hypothetical protein